MQGPLAITATYNKFIPIFISVRSNRFYIKHTLYVISIYLKYNAEKELAAGESFKAISPQNYINMPPFDWLLIELIGRN